MSNKRHNLGSLEPRYPFIVRVVGREGDVVEFEQFGVDKWHAMELTYSKFYTIQDDRSQYSAKRKHNIII